MKPFDQAVWKRNATHAYAKLAQARADAADAEVREREAVAELEALGLASYETSGPDVYRPRGYCTGPGDEGEGCTTVVPAPYYAGDKTPQLCAPCKARQKGEPEPIPEAAPSEGDAVLMGTPYDGGPAFPVVCQQSTSEEGRGLP